MKRYAQNEVAEAHAQVERCVFTPHAQIVLSAEVRALETIVARIEACVDSAERRPETWAFRDLVAWLRAALEGGA